jgi:transcriptional regulator
MYKPKRYKETDQAKIRDLIRDFPFAIFIAEINGKVDAVHLPFILHEGIENDCLVGHIPHANPISEYIKSKALSKEEVFLIFRSPSSYISSSWYKEPDAPTWDYAAVHCRCHVSIQSQDELWESLNELVSHFEKNESNSIDLERLPSDVKKQSTRIMGFELKVFSYEAQFKLSQGRPEEDIRSILQHLDNNNTDPSLIRLIKEHNE